MMYSQPHDYKFDYMYFALNILHTRAGHQKKIMLAIDRLTRINANVKRLSSVDHKGSTEVLEPASSYPTPQWLDTDSPTRLCQYGPPSSPKYYPSKLSPSYAGSRYNKSRENLACVTEAIPLSQPMMPLRDDGAGHIVHMRHSKQNVVYRPDVVAIHVNRTPNVRGSNIPDDAVDGVELGSALVTSFHGGSSVQWDNNALDDTGGDLTPTNDRRSLSTEEQTGGTLRRNMAVINPRVTIKPKPVAKIYAKTKRISREFPPTESLKTGELPTSSSVVYSSNTLPRKSSSKLHEQQTEANQLLLRPSTNHSAPCSPAHAANGKTGGNHQVCRTKKPIPPPPPKRTNSIKSDVRPVQLPRPPQSTVAKLNAPSVPQQQNMHQVFSSCVASLAERGNTRPDGETSATHPVQTSDNHSNGAVDNVAHTGTDSDLTDVIKRLEQTAAPCTTAAETFTNSGGATSYTSGASTLPNAHAESILRTKERASGGSESPRRNDSTISLESNVSVGSTDSNTLPFANENVGTIKQRNPSSKTSVVSISTEEDAPMDNEVFQGYAAVDSTNTGTDHCCDYSSTVCKQFECNLKVPSRFVF